MKNGYVYPFYRWKDEKGIYYVLDKKNIPFSCQSFQAKLCIYCFWASQKRIIRPAYTAEQLVQDWDQRRCRHQANHLPRKMWI